MLGSRVRQDKLVGVMLKETEPWLSAILYITMFALL
jgi:hypothetical protein